MERLTRTDRKFFAGNLHKIIHIVVLINIHFIRYPLFFIFALKQKWKRIQKKKKKNFRVLTLFLARISQPSTNRHPFVIMIPTNIFYFSIWPRKQQGRGPGLLLDKQVDNKKNRFFWGGENS